MSNKIVVKTNKLNDGYQMCDRHFVTLNGILRDDIVIRFVSTNRTDTSYDLIYNSSELNEVFSFRKNKTYAGRDNLYTDIIININVIFKALKIDLEQNELNKISEIIVKCINKCESRFGSNVKDFDKYNADAVLTIKGEDNGKPKFIVKIVNTGHTYEDEMSILNNEVPYDSYYDLDTDSRIYKIDIKAITLDKLIVKLIEEFDNPYLVISPNLEIILDLKADIGYYDRFISKYDRSVEQIKEVFNIINKS